MRILISIFFIFILSFPVVGFGDSISGWSMGVGYHNPPDSTVGVDFMHLWTNWALEFGVGYIGSSESANNQTSTSSSNQSTVYTVGGDFNLKYLFASGSVRPYLQGGVDAAVSTSNSGGVSA